MDVARQANGQVHRVITNEQQARMRRYQDFYWDPRQNFGTYLLTLYRLWLDVSDRVPGRVAAQRVVDSMREPQLRTMANEVLAELAVFRPGVGDEVNFTGYVLEFVRRWEARANAALPDRIPIVWPFPADEAPPLSDNEDDDDDNVNVNPPKGKAPMVEKDDKLHQAEKSHGECSVKRPRLA